MNDMKYKEGEFKDTRSVEESTKEILDRLTYFYKKIDGSFEWETPYEAQLLPIVLEHCKKVLLKTSSKNMENGK